MLDSLLENLSPGNIAYLAMALVAFVAFAVTLGAVKVWSDRAPAPRKEKGTQSQVAEPELRQAA